MEKKLQSLIEGIEMNLGLHSDEILASCAKCGYCHDPREPHISVAELKSMKGLNEKI